MNRWFLAAALLLPGALPASAQDPWTFALADLDQDVQHPNYAPPYQVALCVTYFRFGNADFQDHFGEGLWAQWVPPKLGIGFEFGLNVEKGRVDAERDASGDEITRGYELGVICLGVSFRNADLGFLSWQTALASLVCRFDFTAGLSIFLSDFDDAAPWMKVGPYAAFSLSTVSYKSFGGYLRFTLTDPLGDPHVRDTTFHVITMLSIGVEMSF